jgi:hypothetical protein
LMHFRQPKRLRTSTVKCKQMLAAEIFRMV